MSTQPLFYKKIVPLNKDQHHNLYVEPVKDFNHTKETNSLYIAAVEFLKACKEYPIVFAKSPQDDSVFPVVLLGLKGNQNLFVNKKGEWLANYIPAYVRRYPFILATDNTDGGNFAVCIDESYPGFNIDKKGQKLFDKKGVESKLLQQSLEFLKDYQSQIQLTNLFCKTLNELDILEPMQANIEIKGGEKLSLAGFMGVNRSKLKAIKPDKLAELVKTDQLELIYAHLGSLDNINKLMALFN